MTKPIKSAEQSNKQNRPSEPGETGALSAHAHLAIELRRRVGRMDIISTLMMLPIILLTLGFAAAAWEFELSIESKPPVWEQFEDDVASAERRILLYQRNLRSLLHDQELPEHSRVLARCESRRHRAHGGRAQCEYRQTFRVRRIESRRV